MKEVGMRARSLVALCFVFVQGCPGTTPSPPPAAPAPAPAPAAAPPPAPAPAAEQEAPKGFGTIKGHVTVGSPKTPPPHVTPDKNPEVCGTDYDPASLKIAPDGGLSECVVFVKGPKAPADWDKTGSYVIDQQACHYTPRVLIVPVGQTVVFKSSDPVFHNVNAGYKAFNEAINKGDERKLLCNEAAFADLKCNVHGFMRGWLVVAENPWYTLTDASGSFTLTHVPAGTWSLWARHQDLGKQSASGVPVTVEPDKETVLDLKFQ
ncbi:MAG TPA: carboxypeptidase regulatory-like domain-containing protein [Planctomycetota bacterium]|nr:carboxypeptidase regulatory-like domain-containing protein [Planctomycetota bacterium]